MVDYAPQFNAMYLTFFEAVESLNYEPKHFLLLNKSPPFPRLSLMSILYSQRFRKFASTLDLLKLLQLCKLEASLEPR
jgi:hypothetical protein